MDFKLTLKRAVAEEEPVIVLQSLLNEEANLMVEKKNLHKLLASLRANKEKLLLKTRKEIERRKLNIKKLKAEIRNLKLSCEELVESLRII